MVKPSGTETRLYSLRLTEYDTSSAALFLIRAVSEEQARAMASNHPENYETPDRRWLSAETSSCVEVRASGSREVLICGYLAR